MTRLSDLRWAILLVSLAITVRAAPVAGQDAKAILVLHSYGFDTPARGPFDLAFARTVRGATDLALDLYVETLDPNRFAGEPQARLTRAYLREKYADKHIAVIAVVYDSALAFVLDEREPLFPDVPVAALVTRSAQSLPERAAVITSGNAIGQSAALALRLNPRATHIAVIDGAPHHTGRKAVGAELQTQIQALGVNLPVSFLFDLPLDELLVRVRALPPDTIIVMVNQYIGPGGKPIAQPDAVTELAKAAPAPLYVIGDGMTGYGALGGMVLSIEDLATDLAKLALRIAREGAVHVPPTESSLVPMFDWRELRRWGISEARLPAGSIVQFRQLSAWDLYKGYIMGSLAIVTLQSIMIAGLMVQRARRRRIELALRESEQHFRVMADTAPVMIWRSGVDNACDFFNKPWLDFRGRTMEQEQGSGWLEGVHPDDVAHCRHTSGDADPRRAPAAKEYRLRRADGEYRWVLDVGVPRYDEAGGLAGYIGSALDITERKRVEEQNHDLAGRLLHAQEAERARIGRDLHDDVCQRLAVLAIMLTGLKHRLSGSTLRPDVEEALTTLQERTATLVGDVRNLSHDLHPSVLGHAGLVPVLKAHCDEVARQQKLDVTFSADEGVGAVDSDVALCIYRVTQEALTNTGKHASASAVGVRLTQSAEAIELEVIDNGVGFVASERTGGGLGLHSIDERVRLIRGSVSVESRVGRGTTLLVRIPRSVQELERVGVS